MGDGTWMAVQQGSEQAPSQVHTLIKADSPDPKTDSESLTVTDQHSDSANA